MKDVRISVPVARVTWCELRRMAEEQKLPNGRSSIAAIVRDLILKALEGRTHSSVKA